MLAVEMRDMRPLRAVGRGAQQLDRVRVAAVVAETVAMVVPETVLVAVVMVGPPLLDSGSTRGSDPRRRKSKRRCPGVVAALLGLEESGVDVSVRWGESNAGRIATALSPAE